jgi:hypothetical protein
MAFFAGVKGIFTAKNDLDCWGVVHFFVDKLARKKNVRVPSVG